MENQWKTIGTPSLFTFRAHFREATLDQQLLELHGRGSQFRQAIFEAAEAARATGHPLARTALARLLAKGLATWSCQQGEPLELQILPLQLESCL